MYRIPCSYGAVYVGTIKRRLNTRIGDMTNRRYGQVEKLAGAEHTLMQDKDNHRIHFEDTQVLERTINCCTKNHRKATEIHKYSKTFTRQKKSHQDEQNADSSYKKHPPATDEGPIRSYL